MKKIKNSIISAVCVLILLTTAISAATFSTSLSYGYTGSYRNKFVAKITESGGSPTSYKKVEGSYTEYDKDSKRETSFKSFSSSEVQGQLTYTKTSTDAWSMNKVNCVFYVMGNIIATRSLGY